jgi:hypothetical protein
MVFFGLGIGIGWNDSDQMVRCAQTAALILGFYYYIRIFGNVSDFFLEPFKSAICVLGGNILYLAMLIMSSRYYRPEFARYDQGNTKYGPMNILMLLILVQGTYVSSVYSIEGLKNTTIVYMILWVIEKYFELYFMLSDNAWMFIFSMSVMVYYLALEANKHPEFVVSLFKSDKF